MHHYCHESSYTCGFVCLLFLDDMFIWCNQLLQLEKISLTNNHFEGAIPRSIGNCTSLQGLYLQNNLFTGIPLTFLHHASSSCMWLCLFDVFSMICDIRFDTNGDWPSQSTSSSTNGE